MKKYSKYKKKYLDAKRDLYFINTIIPSIEINQNGGNLTKRLNFTYKEIKEHFKDIVSDAHLNQYNTNYQKDEQSRLYRVNNYKPPKSDIQFKTIVANGDYRDYANLSILVSFLINDNFYNKLTYDMLKLDSDKEIYEIIKKNTKNNISYIDRKYKFDAVVFYDILKYIEKINNIKINVKEYLDYGCGECKFTKYFGEKLGLNNENIYGTDIEDVFQVGWDKNRPSDINLKYIIDKKIPYDDDKFDLISALMVLHHVDDLDHYMNEIKRIMKNGGYLLIKEHDAFDDFDKMLIDIEHIMYMIHHKDFEEMKNKYSANYYNWLEWDLILEKYGFKWINAYHLSRTTKMKCKPTRHYYSLYQLYK